MCVVARVFFHLRGQRTSRPIRFLGALRQFDFKITLDQCGQAELPNPDQTRRNDCVEDSFRDKVQRLVAAIADRNPRRATQSPLSASGLASGVRSTPANGSTIKSRIEREKSARWIGRSAGDADEDAAKPSLLASSAERSMPPSLAWSRKADLQQAKFFAVTMQTVRFGIDRDAVARLDLRDQIRQAGALMIKR